MITEQDVLTRLETEPADNKADLQARNAICNGCPKKESLVGVAYCDECKCILLFKTAFRYAKCPLGKWATETPPWVNGDNK